MKVWEKAVKYKWSAGAAHTFLLHLNVSDLVWNEEKQCFESLTEHIISSTILEDACFIGIYNRADGVQFPSEEAEETFLKFYAALHPKTDSQGNNVAVEYFYEDRRKLSYALKLFSEMLQISSQNPTSKVRKAIEDAELTEYVEKRKAPFFAVILEYLETISPVDSATTTYESDRNAVVTLQVWAKSAKIEKARNVIFFLGSAPSVAPELRSQTNGIVPLKIEFPDLEDRLHTIQFWRNEFKPNMGDLADMPFAHLSAGMSRRAIRNVIKEANIKNAIVTSEGIFKEKKKIIEDQSGGLLEILQPTWGLEAIGGLNEHKKYIAEVSSAMREGNLLAVPMGILLLGSYGTGKTVFAEAVAHEAGIPFVKMKGIREKWVGQSERNLYHALELIKAQAPVVVFIDEIDQQYQSRSAMGDNTGVNNRMQGELFQVMSDTNWRGKILWLGASNRPDLLDPAMLREGRFDEKVPFFPPEARERGEILLALFEKLKIQAIGQKTEFKYHISPEFALKFGIMAHWHLSKDEGLTKCDPDTHTPDPDKEEGADILALTGAQIEKIINDAYKLAVVEKTIMDESHLLKALSIYLPTPNFILGSKMTDEAIAHCTSKRFIPAGKWEKRSNQLRSQSSNEPTRKISFG